MTAQFVGAAGEGAVPIAAGSPLPGGLSLSQLERRLQKKIVLVSPALLGVLARCSGVPSLSDLERALATAPPANEAPLPGAELPHV